MAVEFDLDKFKKQMNNKNEKMHENVVDKKYASDKFFSNKVFRENKKRYNFTLKPSMKNILKIEAKKRNISQSELIEVLIENTFGVNNENN